MEKLTHTPGPWHVVNGTDHRHFGVQMGQAGGFLLTSTIADNFADAKLIAAAPDLLAALRSLVSYLRSDERWPIKSEHMAYLGDAERAIAKAEAR